MRFLTSIVGEGSPFVVDMLVVLRVSMEEWWGSEILVNVDFQRKPVSVIEWEKESIPAVSGQRLALNARTSGAKAGMHRKDFKDIVRITHNTRLRRYCYDTASSESIRRSTLSSLWLYMRHRQHTCDGIWRPKRVDSDSADIVGEARYHLLHCPSALILRSLYKH